MGVIVGLPVAVAVAVEVGGGVPVWVGVVVRVDVAVCVLVAVAVVIAVGVWLGVAGWVGVSVGPAGVSVTFTIGVGVVGPPSQAAKTSAPSNSVSQKRHKRVIFMLSPSGARTEKERTPYNLNGEPTPGIRPAPRRCWTLTN